MHVADAVLATGIFTVILLASCALSLRSRISSGVSLDAVQELKGFAILAVVFSHVGFFLASDRAFLFPLSTIAGVGVDLFLLASGFGLAASAISKPKGPLDFYKRRLGKLLIPFWVSLGAFFTLAFLSGAPYPFDYILRSFAGWFPSADIYTDVNSPLWYITFILFYYLLFPLVFSFKRPFVSALLLFVIPWGILAFSPAFLKDVIHLYELHIIAFPLGALFAVYLSGKTILPPKSLFLQYGLLAILAGAVGYLALHGNVGEGKWIEQGTSVLNALLVSAFFVFKRFEIKLLSLFGFFSYEIYLLHWPIMLRYDIFFWWLPPYLALAAYLGLFIALGWCIQAIVESISRKQLHLPLLFKSYNP